MGKSMGLRIIAMLLTVMLLLNFAGPFAVPASAATMGYISNEYISAYFSDKGRFSFGTNKGDPSITTDDQKNLLYNWSYPSATSSTLLSVNGSTSFFSAEVNSFSADGRSCVSTDTIGNVLVTQTVSIEYNAYTQRYDVFKVHYELKNNGTSSVSLGARVMLDTMLGSNDNAPFRIPGYGNLSTQKEFSGSSVPQYFTVVDNLSNPTVVATGTLYTNAYGEEKPDSLQFIGWNQVKDTVFTFHPSVSTGSSYDNDSAVATYWNPKSVPAGGTRSFAIYYGIGSFEPAVAEGNLNAAIIAPAELLLTNNEQAYQMNPFTVETRVENGNNVAVSDVRVSISLPNGLTLSDGSTSKTIAVPARGEESAAFSVTAPILPVEKTYNYTVQVDSAALEEPVVFNKTIKVPAAKCLQVTYAANGGSGNIPADSSYYRKGDTVSVKFDPLPERVEHTFLGWATDRNASAPQYTKDGTKTFAIGDAHVTLYAIWRDDHVHSYTQTITQPTCTERGYTTYTCACGDSYISDYTEPKGHDYQYTTTVEPTCTADGYMRYTCADCSAKKDQVLHATGHEFGDDNVCDKCGFTIPQSHVHSFKAVVTAPTCTGMGYTTYTCSCGYTYKDSYIDQTGHKWNAGVVTKEATCTVDGLRTFTCSACGETMTEVIEADHDWDETVTREATCTVDGSKTCSCKRCGEEKVEVIPAGHKWNAGVVTKEATCTEPGAKTVTCTACGATESQELPALGHDFYNGYCKRCGIGIPGIVTPNPEHTLYGMFFAIDEILSNYGRETINEYGVYLDHNSDAKIERVGVYLTQEGNMWRRAIACVGEDIPYATYVPYLAKDKEVKYSGLNSNQINIFRLSENSDGIWCYSDYTTIGVNLEDSQGNLLLSLYDIGQAGKDTRIFTDLQEMIAWLKYGDCEHSFTEAVTPPTCKEQGYTTHTCSKCGHSYKDSFTTGTIHDYQYTTTVEPTCTADGYMRYTCAVCGDVKDQILYATGHQFGDDNVCDNCGFTIPVTHTHAFTEVVTAPSCTGMGYTTYTCSCGYTYKDNYIDQTGHKWDEGTVSRSQTCTEEGRMTYTCTVCHEKREEIIPAGHDWEDIFTKEATCTEDGFISRKCKACGKTETEVLPAGHKWDEGTVTKEPTCTEPGIKAVTCTACRRTDVLEIPALGHEFVNGICKRCGAGIEDVIVPDYDHTLYGMFFRIKDIISDYGSEPINEYGVYLDHNPGAKIEKVGVYLTQEGNMWRRAIACVGEDITYATYVPYLSYDEDIKYTGLNSPYINNFRLSKNSDGIWCYSNYTTIGVNLTDSTGKLLLTLTDIGQAGKDTRIFTDLDEMIEWLKTPETKGDFTNDDVVDVNDVEYLLWHTIMGNVYPVGPEADFDGDGQITSNDVILLLLYITMPDMFPLN